MGKKCVDMNKSVSNAVQRQLKDYKDQVTLALTKFIGRPTKVDAYVAYTKREIREAEYNYEWHTKLFDMLSDFLMEMGEIAFSYGAYLDPSRKISSWYNMLNHKFGFPISPTSLLQVRRIKSVHLYMERIIHINRTKKGLKPWERAIMPPALVAAKSDKFGIVDDIVRSSELLTDKVRQDYAGFKTRMEAVNIGVTNNIDALLRGGFVTLNNSSMDGLTGFYDRDRKAITILKEDKRSFTVIYDDDPNMKRVKLKKSDVNMSPDRRELIESIKLKYRDELVSDLVHGQVRYIIPKSVPVDPSKRKKWLKTSDGKAVSNKLNRMKIYGDNNMPSPDVRSRTYKGVKYSYVTVKQGEESYKEKYHIYLIQIEDIDGTIQNTINTGYNIPEFNEALKEGFYKSESKEYMTPVLTKRMRFIKDSADKRWRRFRYMQRQPNKYVMDEPAIQTADPLLVYNTLWDKLLVLRTVHKEMAIDLTDRFESEEQAAVKVLRKIKDNLKARGDMSDESIKVAVDQLMNLSGVRDMSLMAKDNTMHSSNSFFTLIGENYGPVIFHLRESDMFIDTTLANLRERKEQMWDELTSDERDQIKEDIAQMEEYAEINAGLSDDSTDEYKGKLIFLQKAVYTKHRTKFTDESLRRKDDRVYSDYMERTYRTIERNALVNKLVLGTLKLSEISKDSAIFADILDYTINRVKMAVGDPDTFAGWRKNWGNKEVANFVNTVKGAAGLRQNWDAADAEKVFLTMNSIITARLLTARPALGNRTQTINDAITAGFPILFKAWKEYKSPYWQAIINNTGGLQQVSMFQDIMMAGQDVTMTDAGVISHPLLRMATFGFSESIPTMNVYRWIKIWKLGRDKFIDNAKTKKGPKEILKIYEFLMREADKAEGIERKDIEYLAENWWDLFFATEGVKDEKFVRARIKNLAGIISENKLKKMVSWTLSYMFNSKLGEEFFTFTGGEKANRSITIVTSLMLADTIGALGSTKEIVEVPDDSGAMVKVEDKFLSETAVNIARNAVYSHQFGMSQVYLGEIFGGAGKTIFQYKAYPTQQLIFDFNKMSNFMRGSSGQGDQILRLMAEAGRTVNNWWLVRKGDKTKKYSPGQFGPDHEARATLRQMLSRLLASIFAAFTEMLPGIGYSIRMMSGSASFGAIRSMENPIAAVFFRLIALNIVLGMDWDDDDHNIDMLDDITRLILPVYISIIINVILELQKAEERGELPLIGFPSPRGRSN